MTYRDANSGELIDLNVPRELIGTVAGELYLHVRRRFPLREPGFPIEEEKGYGEMQNRLWRVRYDAGYRRRLDLVGKIHVPLSERFKGDWFKHPLALVLRIVIALWLLVLCNRFSQQLWSEDPVFFLTVVACLLWAVIKAGLEMGEDSLYPWEAQGHVGP